MADNLGYTPGSGATVASNEVDGLHYQKVKITDGKTGNTVMQRVITGTPDAADGGAVVRQAPVRIWTCGFSGVSASSLIAPEMTQRRAGTGVTVAQSSGSLVITSGTTANAEYLARSTTSFKGSHIHKFSVTLSQRIANNNFAYLLADMIGEGLSCTINSATSISVTKTAHGFTADNVGQSMMVGAISGAAGVPGRYAIASIPDANTINFTVSGWPSSGSCTVDLFGWNYITTLFNGTSATSNQIDTQRRGWNNGYINGGSTTTANAVLYQINNDGNQVYWNDIGVSANPLTTTSRTSRVTNIPNQDVELYFYLWSYNGTSAPASSTTWTTGFVSVEEIPNVPTYLAGMRPNGSMTPMPITVQNYAAGISARSNLDASTNLIGDTGTQYRANATGAASVANINSPATPAAQSVKASAGRLLQVALVNHGSSTVFMKFFNTASPTLGTTAAAFEIALPPNIAVNISSEGGLAFSSAIVVAITGARGLTNNSTITADTVTGFLAFA